MLLGFNGFNKKVLRLRLFLCDTDYNFEHTASFVFAFIGSTISSVWITNMAVCGCLFQLTAVAVELGCVRSKTYNDKNLKQMRP